MVPRKRHLSRKKKSRNRYVKKEDDSWTEDSFAETMDSEAWEKKKRTFHMKHDEEMNFSCKKCNKKISAHNNDWHGSMYDECFNEMLSDA